MIYYKLPNKLSYVIKLSDISVFKGKDASSMRLYQSYLHWCYRVDRKFARLMEKRENFPTKTLTQISCHNDSIPAWPLWCMIRVTHLNIKIRGISGAEGQTIGCIGKQPMPSFLNNLSWLSYWRPLILILYNFRNTIRIAMQLLIKFSLGHKGTNLWE